MNRKRLKSLGLVVALLPVPLLWCVLFSMGGLNRARDWSMDLRFWLRGELEAPVKVVYVDIDSKAIDAKEIGGWPWSRHYFATVARTLIEEAGVKVVGIDIVLSDSGVAEIADLEKLIAGNREFGRYLHSDQPVVLAASFSGNQFRDVNGNLYRRELPRLSDGLPPIDQIEGPEVPNFMVGHRAPPYAPGGVGLIDTDFGGTRRVPLWAPTNVRTYFHLSIEILRRYWDVGDFGVKVNGDVLEFVSEDGQLLHSVPMLDGQMLEVNWFSKWNSSAQNPRISFADVYAYAHLLTSGDEVSEASAREFFAQDDFKDAIVLIGPVDPLLQDLAPTPLDPEPVPKVGVHGNVIKTIASGIYLQRLPPWQIYSIVFGLTIVVSVMSSWGGGSSGLARLLAILLMLGYLYLSIHWFIDNHLVLPMVTPVGSALSTTLLAVGWQAMREQKAKGRIKGMFGTYLAPMVVESMVESGRDPELGGHDAEITAYFSDIQSFSAFSEVLTSSQLGELLNEYLTACTDIIQAEGGTLDKYIGDAVVAMFGAPVDLENHAYKACLTSQLVQVRLDELRQKWISEGDKWPALVHQMRTRIGLNTGDCMIGNMGSRTRFNYTMMGDNVNLAARMESGAKSWGSFNMVTEATRDACEKHGGDRIVFRPLGRIIVKGRSKPVPIFDIVGLRENLSADTFKCIDLFQQGMAHYYRRDWAGAAERFQQSATLEPVQPGRDLGVKSTPSLVYRGIVAEMERNPPPADWDGVYVMTEK
ncbi:CHASE2 domain-containing protein [Synoicihabitans lomoniglobus]|uniref:Adenylate/guanylate cyclase domain-containing protein n=1 Tax=Synoicihabitans lomoniglobus TaxID=2909285 RepID=A0AAF0I2T8_9BACT|nr:adenylate/guanylate cyclase domain-containing protein [Opitutaceae bacterium LMO-M01]WED65938.1 adenylate/guanylate cyclase domain-containing protein [Opitutaceae bacterium LMO-M01]